MKRYAPFGHRDQGQQPLYRNLCPTENSRPGPVRYRTPPADIRAPSAGRFSLSNPSKRCPCAKRLAWICGPLFGPGSAFLPYLAHLPIPHPLWFTSPAATSTIPLGIRHEFLFRVMSDAIGCPHRSRSPGEPKTKHLLPSSSSSIQTRFRERSYQFAYIPKPYSYMRRPYLTSDRLRLRFPMPHPHSISVVSALASPLWCRIRRAPAPRTTLRHKTMRPQNVQLVPSATQPAPSASSSDRAIPGQSTQTGSTTSLGSTELHVNIRPARLCHRPLQRDLLVDNFSRVTGVPNDSGVGPPCTRSVCQQCLVSHAKRVFLESVFARVVFYHPISGVRVCVFLCLAVRHQCSRGSQGIGHDAAFYAGVALGVFILIACPRHHHRPLPVAAIAWDPVVAKPSSLDLESDFSLTGDRDVGEPKRSDSFLGDDLNERERTAVLQPTPFVETAYYSPHQVPSLVDSAAYPLPPHARPPLTSPLSNSGPYPTVRPLPAHLADRDPHRLTRMSGSASASARSSRSGSVRSHLPSASTLCFANGRRQGRLRRWGCAEHAEDGRNDMADVGGGWRRAAWPTSNEQGRCGRRESFARRAPGGTPGWVRMPAPPPMRPCEGQGQGEGWTIDAARERDGCAARRPGVGAPREEGDDGAGARAEYAAREAGGGDGVAAALSHGTSGTAIDSDGDGMSVRTENSRVPLVARPRPAAVVVAGE
ncbi:hypothetical protein B0H14DRAFT_3869929 [Mycena olivaceomarginata]|nr:hypothetical protein B0H14DRAFT_3869929 [Mycena olivaceomarginata]